MRLAGERGAARARALVESFRPRAARADVVLSSFGPFPGVPRNATADMMRSLAEAGGIALRSPSFRAPDFAVGRGALRLPSGRDVRASILVLPVVWDAAAALVAREARATRAPLVIMSGVAGPAQPVFFEAIASGARARSPDAFGLRPSRRAGFARVVPATLAVDRARAAMQAALDADPDLRASVPAIERRESGADNAYVCNATAHVTSLAARRARHVLRSARAPEGIRVDRFHARHGFVHWPRDVRPEHVAACARLLLVAVDALV